MHSKELFEILVRENARVLSTFLRASGCDENLADDIWQETMIVAWRKLDEFDRSKPFAPWLRGIASKIMLAQRRKKYHSRLLDMDALEYLSHRIDHVTQLAGDTLDEKLDALRECVTRLPEADRQCIEMRFQDELLPQAISDRVGVALETIKKRLLRAKQKLLMCLESKMQLNAPLENH